MNDASVVTAKPTSLSFEEATDLLAAPGVEIVQALELRDSHLYHIRQAGENMALIIGAGDSGVMRI